MTVSEYAVGIDNLVDQAVTYLPGSTTEIYERIGGVLISRHVKLRALIPTLTTLEEARARKKGEVLYS